MTCSGCLPCLAHAAWTASSMSTCYGLFAWYLSPSSFAFRPSIRPCTSSHVMVRNGKSWLAGGVHQSPEGDVGWRGPPTHHHHHHSLPRSVCVSHEWRWFSQRLIDGRADRIGTMGKETKPSREGSGGAASDGKGSGPVRYKGERNGTGEGNRTRNGKMGTRCDEEKGGMGNPTPTPGCFLERRSRSPFDTLSFEHLERTS